MFTKSSAAFASLLLLFSAALALPAEQLPLHSYSSKSVQAIQAEYNSVYPKLYVYLLTLSRLRKAEIIPTGDT
jgi:hypothetical protein